MSPLAIAFSALQAIGTLGLLFCGTIFVLFLERLLQARVQHRDGPGRGGEINYWQVWKDFRKTWWKSGLSGLPSRWRMRLTALAWMLLPAAFLLLLFLTHLPSAIRRVDLPILLLLPLLAVALESFLMHATTDARERFERRHRVLMRATGVGALVLSVLAVGLHVGALTLDGISGFQAHFPFHSALSSPGLLLAGLTGFCAIFLFGNEGPVRPLEEQSLNRSLQYFSYFVRKMWVVCLLAFWIYVFGGGADGLIAKAVFPLKMMLSLFVFLLLEASFPRMRVSDAGEFTIRWLLPLCLVSFFLEVVWIGVRL